MCEATYDLREGLSADVAAAIDEALPGPSVLHCFRDGFHEGSHVARRETHVSIWDDEWFYDFYAPEGFGAVCKTPRPVG